MSTRRRSVARDHWVSTLRGQLGVYGIHAPDLVEEHRFLTERKFRFDFALPALKIGIEVEGGVFSGGRAGELVAIGGRLVSRPGGKSRHTTGAGYERDCLKYSLAAIAGWMVLRFTSPMIVRGEAARMVQDAIRARSLTVA